MTQVCNEGETIQLYAVIIVVDSPDELLLFHLDHYLWIKPLLKLVGSYGDIKILFGAPRASPAVEKTPGTPGRGKPDKDDGARTESIISSPKVQHHADSDVVVAALSRPGTAASSTSTIDSAEIDALVENSIKEFVETGGFSQEEKDAIEAKAKTEEESTKTDDTVPPIVGETPPESMPLANIDEAEKGATPPQEKVSTPKTPIEADDAPMTEDLPPLPPPAPLRFRPPGQAAMIRRRVNLLKTFALEVK